MRILKGISSYEDDNLFLPERYTCTEIGTKNLEQNL